MRKLDRAGDKLGDIIFDGLDDSRLFSESNDNFSLNLRVKRRVFDNADILNSWTVVDRFEMSGGIPLANDALSVAGSAFSNMGFWISANSRLDFVNIRQVLPSEYPNLPPPEALKNEVQTAEWYREYLAAQAAEKESPLSSEMTPEPDGEWVKSEGEKGKFKFRLSDPEDHARYSKLWKLLVFPFRFPMKASSIARLQDGEIVSYRGEGSLELGASVGWNPDLTNLTSSAQAGLSYQTYVSGAHRISVMRETARFVRVKASRVATVGHSMTAGADFKPAPLDGIIIIKNIQKNLRIIPFNLVAGDSLSKIFDVGYRYDLSVPEARKAYELAVIGRLGLSDELAVDSAGNPTDFAKTGVEKVFTRHAKASNSSQAATLRIGFIWKRNARASVNAIDAIITFPDGKHHVFTSEVLTSTDWRLLWGTREKLEHNFTVSMDLNEFAKNPEKEDAFHLMMEGRIQDTDTSEKEMTAYTLEVENSVGKPKIFPLIPNIGGLGRSHFYYQIALDNALIRKLIETPENQMWRLLEKAFEVPEGSWATKKARRIYRMKMSALTALNVPLYVTGFNIERGSNLRHANKIYKRWKRLRLVEDPKKRAEALGKMFFDRIYGYELMRLVRSALDGETISYYASGYNNSFGRIVDQGGSQLRFDNIATKVRREIDFDHEGSRTQDGNPLSTISNLTANVLSYDSVELAFELAETPVALFLQLRIDNWWWPFRDDNRCSLLVPNLGNFKKGENKIVLDRTDTASPWYPLAKELVNGNIYAASLATNTDRIHWGPVAIEKFRLPKK
ncbi:MAG: hypothetical protein A2X94_07460 [Bdellovibrionales bacterium GWB1_55_8]|nr:MAG: hypothetical protein A2X94_07460 [Bdellovibrionales bacterium GWB1_55_8]